MRIQFPNFESGVRNTTILYRGRDMYNEGSVTAVYSRGGNSWEFDVSSAYSRGISYDVHIRVQDDRVTYKNCTCPYDRTSICKHIVACFYVIRAQNLLDGDEDDDDDDEEDESGEYEDYDDDDDGYYYNDDDDDEEDEDEEEEEEVVNNSMEVDRIINERKVAKEIKEAKALQTQKNGKTEIVSLKKMGEDFVENEFHCQVCLEVMDDPVLMPCSAHSMCYDCSLMMYKHKDKEPDGHRLLSCPTCGEASGTFKFKSAKDIKINLEMKRIKEAYDNERRAWSQEKETLQEIVSQVKPESSGDSEDTEESEESEDSNKSKKVVKTKEKGCVIDKQIEQLEDVKKLQEVAGKILIKLKSKGIKLDSFVEKILKEAGKTTEDKSKRLKRKAEDSNKENTEAAEDRYPLRNLKRTKTTGV